MHYKKDIMTIKELKEILSQYDENTEVLIDKSVDGGFVNIVEMEEYDIQKYDFEENKIIIGWQT